MFAGLQHTGPLILWVAMKVGFCAETCRGYYRDWDGFDQEVPWHSINYFGFSHVEHIISFLVCVCVCVCVFGHGSVVGVFMVGSWEVVLQRCGVEALGNACLCD